jgi:hypothetical protein
MDHAHPAATAALGQAALVGHLRAKGMFWLLIPLILLSCVISVLPLGWFTWVLLIAVLPGGIIAALVYMFRTSLSYSVHPQGFALQRGWRFLPYFGRRVELYRWDEIVAVYRRIVSRYAISRPRGDYDGSDEEHSFVDVISRYEIVTTDGRRAVLDSTFGEVLETGDVILGEVKRRLLPDYLDGYDRGNAVAFGPLTLRQDGLTFGPHDRDWSDIVGLSVNKGILTVEFGGGQTWDTPLGSIPNVDLLLTILAQRVPELWVAANPAHFAEQKRLWTGPDYRR